MVLLLTSPRLEGLGFPAPRWPAQMGRVCQGQSLRGVQPG